MDCSADAVVWLRCCKDGCDEGSEDGRAADDEGSEGGLLKAVVLVLLLGIMGLPLKHSWLRRLRSRGSRDGSRTGERGRGSRLRFLMLISLIVCRGTL